MDVKPNETKPKICTYLFILYVYCFQVTQFFSSFFVTGHTLEQFAMDSDFSDDEITDSEFSSDEEAFREFLAWERRPYTVKPRVDHFTDLDDLSFSSRFRLPKEIVLHILTLIEVLIESPTDRNHSIPPIIKLLLTLRYYALGTFLQAARDFCGVSKSSASKIVKQVSHAIASLHRQYIRMPANEEIQRAQLEFYKRSRLPKIIGAIDCTHIKIISPGGPHAENFRNRKGYFSLNVQTVSSENLKIIDLVARWPGSTHDQTIFNRSKLKNRFETGEFGNSIIAADSGYANTQYMITPFLNTPTENHNIYNEAVIRTRNPVERSYGVWKKKFPVLSLGMLLKLTTCQTVIIATAILHNIAIDLNCPVQNDVPDELPWEPLIPLDNNAVMNTRDMLLLDYIPNLNRA